MAEELSHKEYFLKALLPAGYKKTRVLLPPADLENLTLPACLLVENAIPPRPLSEDEQRSLPKIREHLMTFLQTKRDMHMLSATCKALFARIPTPIPLPVLVRVTCLDPSKVEARIHDPNTKLFLNYAIKRTVPLNISSSIEADQKIRQEAVESLDTKLKNRTGQRALANLFRYAVHDVFPDGSRPADIAVDFGILLRSPADSLIGKALASVAKWVKTFSISGTANIRLDTFPILSNLRELHLPFCSIKQACGLTGKFPALEVLNLPGNTGLDMYSVPSILSLKALDVSDCDLKSISTITFDRFPKLETLDLHGNNIDLAQLTPHPVLKILNVAMVGLIDGSWISAESFPKLQVLSLKGNSGFKSDTIPDFPGLQDLDLSNCDLHWQGLTRHRFPDLTHLDLTGNRFEDEEYCRRDVMEAFGKELQLAILKPQHIVLDQEYLNGSEFAKEKLKSIRKR